MGLGRIWPESAKATTKMRTDSVHTHLVGMRQVLFVRIHHTLRAADWDDQTSLFGFALCFDSDTGYTHEESKSLADASSSLSAVTCLRVIRQRNDECR